DAAHDRPAARQPRLEHPANRAAHDADAQEHAPPRMAEQYLPGREEQALRRRVFRHVAGLGEYVETFKERPQRMRRIRHAAVREGIAREKITEFVVNAR